MIKISDKPISPQSVANRVKTSSSGCVILYIGLIRDYSHNKAVLSVEYKDVNGTAENNLRQIASEVGDVRYSIVLGDNVPWKISEDELYIEMGI